MTKTLPIREWYVRLESVHDADAVRAGWTALVKGQGWSPVGEPEIVRDGTPAVVGRLVMHPGLQINPEVGRTAIYLPE